MLGSIQILSAFIANILTSCCDVSYGLATDGVPSSTSSSTLPGSCVTDTCKFNVEDVLCQGPYSDEYKKHSRECLFKLLACKNSDISLCKDICKENREPIYQKLCKYISCKYNSNNFTYEIFCLIWNHFGGDCHKIVVFFTHIIHNTSGFIYLTGWKRPEWGNWYSRGILQIIGQENYALAGPQFINNPNLMASLSCEAILGSLRVYSHRVPHKAQYTLCDSWYYLNPEEIQGQNYTYDFYQRRITDRINVYIELVGIFCVKPRWGTTCYFVQRYIPQMCRVLC
ncbi:hypothetical protein M153_2800000189 [Pseudoloma neurophilia]|uniref:Uncharacterized protein n=1 Tax=Pseudoloma neurophilia TaxID=146866 RepID=A0A0R0M186_9MICR|nr:hypothetical protein M153_2800000189 [Pseudoloma neurophilia]